METPASFFLFTILVALAFGLKKSAIINNIFTVSNIIIVLFVIIAGSFKGKNNVKVNNFNGNITEKI